MANDTRSDRGIWKKALITVPAIVIVGFLMGIVSNSGFANGWYADLAKPSFQPPGWAFGAVWTTLYTMMGIALAVVLDAPPSAERSRGLFLFGAQLVLNFAWSPIFFGAHRIDLALVVILVTSALVTATIISFWRIRPLAAALLLPYLAWLCLATVLNHETGRLNPGADSHPLGLTGA
ncbi:TspO/MBR family protein [Sphingomonas sp.]|jgi:benzodiazapine receptor|uniref:TspO/MBR family protein n=1 Tax=Sphingomonas sp. TaxID=28214 RepID=UPI0025EB02D1|nr:TspO/MBR family protein [Sphingomonas sp.]